MITSPLHKTLSTLLLPTDQTRDPIGERSTSKGRLLVLSYRFPPESYPLAVSLKGVIDALRKTWTIDVVTAAEDAYSPPNVTTHHVPARSISGMRRVLSAVRLDKLADLLTWPDPFWPWIWPALRTSLQVIEARRPDAILAFTMPFSTGILGTLLKAHTDLPLIINFDDSPTCSDMNPVYPSRLHFELARRMEDTFVRRADRVVYVSEENRTRVAARQPESERSKFELVRCSATSRALTVTPLAPPKAPYRIVYTGAMNGWYALDPAPLSIPKRAFQTWKSFGTYTHTRLDRRSHSPVFLGAAIRRVCALHPEWTGKIQLDVYGNTYPSALVERVLAIHGLKDIVRIHDRVAPENVPALTQSAHLLFLTLPDRVDGTPGGRISLKTYEYLMTDRPILAAVPPGENRTFLQEQPGVFLTAPTDVEAMSTAIEQLAGEHFSGKLRTVPRNALQRLVSATARAESLSRILDDVIRSKAPSAAT